MLQNRVVSLLKSPVAEMTKAKSEQIGKMDTIKNYVAILALIPAIATFIGSAFVGRTYGYGFYSVTYKTPIPEALVLAIVGYIFAIVGVYVLGYAINFLAPNFASKQNENQAMKLAAFAATPGFIAGILNILPSLSAIGSLIGLIGFLYIFYNGLPVLMETPKDKTLVYMIVSIIAYIVIVAIIGVIVGIIMAALFISAYPAGYGYSYW